MRTQHLALLESLAEVAVDLADVADLYTRTPLDTQPDALNAILSRAQCLLADLEALRTPRGFTPTDSHPIE